MIDRAELAEQLDEALAEVSAGASVIVMEGNRTLAQIVPAQAESGTIARQAEIMAAAHREIRNLPRIEGGPWRRADLYER